MSFMRYFYSIWIVIFLLGCSNSSKKQAVLTQNNQQLSHDLSFPAWGPYTKKYIGVSHIPDIDKGIRVDFSFFPGFKNKKTKAPNVFTKSGFHPWEASPNLEYFSFRHELKWKDRVYADISYSKIDSFSRSVRIEFMNQTNSQDSLVLHLLSSIHFPPIKPHNPEKKLNYATISLPENAFWIDALDYQYLNFAKEGHRNDLVYDGMLRAEVRDHELINGSAIGRGFGKNIGDQVVYKLQFPNQIKNGALFLRYKTEKQQKAKLKLKGIVTKIIELDPSENYSFKKIEIGAINAEEYTLSIESKSKTPLVIDGFAILTEGDFNLLKIEQIKRNNVPDIIKGPTSNSIILKYDNIETYYGVRLNHNDLEVRDWTIENLPEEYNIELIDSKKSKFYIDEKAHFTDLHLNPIIINPNSSKIINGIVCTGTKEEVYNRLNKSTQLNYDDIYMNARQSLTNYYTVPEGAKYEFSQKLMEATTISNVVYPVYTQNQYIRHHAPGRKWDCLYTWDSGFIGLGLSQISTERGMENLNAYLNEPEEQSAFIHHGTPLPVQFYLFLELWNKTQSNELVENVYPKLKKYYNFLIGKVESSTTSSLDSGLIRTWDYFYNSGGWDDYPAQKFVHKNKLTKTVAPAISTAHVIRIAKIMQMAAHQLNLKEDLLIYEKDIEQLANALHKYAWDEETGYYGYVNHKGFGQSNSILKYNDSINFNMGLGGASPIIAGICDDNQTYKIVSHLKTKGEIWSDMGLSTIDQTAPYYNKKGYWNGHVWMPHQWFFWKSMLDLGEDDFAHQIAITALDVWKRETEKSYNCYEYFSIETKKGKGWHQFSGLSSPVMSWFNAYYQVGNITTGYDIWIKEKSFNDDFSELEASMKIYHHKNKPFSIIVCLNPKYTYKAYWNGKEVELKEFNKGTLSITIKNNAAFGNLIVKKAFSI